MENNLQFGKRAYTAKQLMETYELDDVKILKNRVNGNLSVGMLQKGMSWDDDNAVLFGAVSHSIDMSKPVIFKECWHANEDMETDEPFIMAINQNKHDFFDYFDEVEDVKSDVPF